MAGVSIPSVAMSIPVVDFEKVLSCSDCLASCDAVQELHSAFTTVGFVFIRNHGIDRRMVGRRCLHVATNLNNMRPMGCHLCQKSVYRYIYKCDAYIYKCEATL